MTTEETTCDSDYEEEEILVFADFKNNINESEASNALVKIIGIDSENPIAEVNGNIFKVIKTSPQTTIPTGWYQHIWATTTRAHCLVPYHTTWGSTDINDRGKYEFSMGTHIIFEENPSPQHIDPIYEKYSKKTFQYLNKTNKVLNFSRIFVESENNTTDTTIPDNITINKQAEKNPLIIDMTYEEALKKLKHDQN
ncbi:uncharacterized protein LOC129950853 isoform X2 [Eupeodes corollae]|uniref:uncharacterized protein LOC129950853 isoform X2 n=1 Tax=Eupeodes corollae TaxID=290404 RepID=UPI0024915F6B|nr:uncharacterized protein LOC129950853 isoform X2 [Eupeodes corollae]